MLHANLKLHCPETPKDMNYHLQNQSQSHENHALKPRKKRLDGDQHRLLETSFNANQKLKAEDKIKLARQLGLPPRQVEIWYQNRRARNKNNVIEHGYRNVQLELGNVMAENIRLENHISMLEHELNNVHQMILSGSTTSASILASVSGSSNEQGNSTSQGNMICNWRDAGNDGIFREEELYTCLTGSGNPLLPLS
ncbi:HOMEOBOX-LEUCINE ZIPPER PROTEIN [Salix viminalis]|uniref:Homeobox-leucine zipper protein n=1 Tax=Salix viminalis TaxID=40686 RepID=A0A9Q0NX98_SALVM|nr:HOMEOBOX-LEUCINE ZIPPER PROTEIN [Salix viminalis]